MKTTIVEIKDKVDELLFILDKDVLHIKENLSRLNELRSLVIKRDEKNLCELLEKLRSETDNYKSQELKRQSVRKELAEILGYEVSQMTLSRLEDVLSGELKDRVAEKKTEIRSLMKEFKKEQISVALLLSECARFNNMLLKSILALVGAQEPPVTAYQRGGTTKRHAETTFVNLTL